VGALVPILAKYLGYLLEWLVKLIESSLSYLTALPYSTLQNISVDLVGLLLIYTFIGLAIAIIISGLKRSLWYALCITTLAFGLRTLIQAGQLAHKDEIVFYSLSKGHWAIDLVSKGQYAFLSDSLLDQQSIDYAIQPNRVAEGIWPSAGQINRQRLEGLGEIVVWQGKTILIAEHCAHEVTNRWKFDFILHPEHPRYLECYSDQNLLIKLVGEDSYQGHDLTRQAYVQPL
jgi:hypothetical protein